MATGVRILLNLNQCGSLIDDPDALERMFRSVLQRSGLTTLSLSVVPYPDGTANFHADLGESHVSGGTYKKARHVALEINVCHESADNTLKARGLAEGLVRGFRPKCFDKGRHWLELGWSSE